MTEQAGGSGPSRRLNTRFAAAGLELTLFGILVAVVGAQEVTIILGAIGVLLVLLSL